MKNRKIETYKNATTPIGAAPDVALFLKAVIRGSTIIRLKTP
jgi:hypothetical protein